MALNENNFLLYAIKNYDMKISSSMEEFTNDMKRFQYLKRLFNRYEENGDLQLRLILNHIIVLYNCFGPAASTMLFYKLQDGKSHQYLKTILKFLNRLPRMIFFDEVMIDTNTIDTDKEIEKRLKTNG